MIQSSHTSTLVDRRTTPLAAAAVGVAQRFVQGHAPSPHPGIELKVAKLIFFLHDMCRNRVSLAFGGCCGHGRRVRDKGWGPEMKPLHGRRPDDGLTTTQH
eukprot:scaffold5506_cov159-Amphora_coffeaeformis.AAC.11